MKNLICAVTVLAVSTAQAATIHVDVANCPGPGNGSEADPYCSIQTAIDNAVDTDEIVVAPGHLLRDHQLHRQGDPHARPHGGGDSGDKKGREP